MEGETHAPDADYEALKAEFSEAEIVQLTLAITNKAPAAAASNG